MASLDFEHEELEFKAFHTAHASLLKTLCDALQLKIASLLQGHLGLQISKIEGRVKDREECIRKFSGKYRNALEEQNQLFVIKDHITDLLGIRIVCLYEDDIWQIADLVRASFGVIEITDKIAKVEQTDDFFGYKGLHMDLAFSTADVGMAADTALPVRQFELQVRKKSIPGPLKRRINVLSALFELADREFRQIRDETEVGLQSAPDETALPDSPIEVPVLAQGGYVKDELNAFTFLKIANHFFKDFAFEPYKVDGFVESIKDWSPSITRPEFNSIVRQKIGVVKRYKQFFEERNENLSFNPYTVIRHCLYLGDKVLFNRALQRKAQETFDAWLAQNMPIEKSAEA